MLTQIGKRAVREKGFSERDNRCRVRLPEASESPPAISISAAMDHLIAECQSVGSPEVEFYDDIRWRNFLPSCR